MSTSSSGARTIVLVSCVAQKQAHAAPARDLYQSAWFKKARLYAEQVGDEWYILSAAHGLLPPDQVIAPYNVTLKTMSSPARQQWVAQVFKALKTLLQPGDRIIILAGARYRDILGPALEVDGHTVEVPMRGLAIGQQLAWLTRANAQLPEDTIEPGGNQ